MCAPLRDERSQRSMTGRQVLLGADRDEEKASSVVKRLIDIGRIEGLERITADILGENRYMIEICKALGFGLRYGVESVVQAELVL